MNRRWISAVFTLRWRELETHEFVAENRGLCSLRCTSRSILHILCLGDVQGRLVCRLYPLATLCNHRLVEQAGQIVTRSYFILVPLYSDYVHLRTPRS